MFDTNTMIKIGAGVVGGLVTLTGTYFWGKRNGKKSVAPVQTAQVNEPGVQTAQVNEPDRKSVV